jgi:hypothetical protein
MTDKVGADRYRRLFERLGDARARQMIDKLQVVALTDLDALHELEAFLERSIPPVASGGAPPHPVSGHGRDGAEG